MLNPKSVALIGASEEKGSIGYTIFENLISLTGAEPVDWPLRLECCGSPLWEKNNSVSLKLMQRKIKDAAGAGADLLCTACTYCQLQFDHVAAIYRRQPDIEDPLPAVLYPQLLGVAMGMDRDDLGLDRNRIQWTDEG